MSVSSSAPRRSSRLMDRAKPAPPPPKKQRLGKSGTPKSVNEGAKPAPPPPKKQRLGKSGTPKSVNEGYHASDSKSGSLSPDTTSNDEITLELLKAFDSDYCTESESDSEPEPVRGNMSDEDDIFFGYWDHLDDGREDYIVDLKRKCRDKSRCKNILKEIGCEPYFIRLSKTYCCKFYARLTEDDAAKLKCVEGVNNVTAASLVAILD